MGKVSLKPLSYSFAIITARPLVTVLVSSTNDVTKGEVPKPQLLTVYTGAHCANTHCLHTVLQLSTVQSCM